MSAAEHVDVIALLVDTHRPYNWTERSFDGYMIAVGDLPIDHVRRAVVESLRSDSKMPSPADLRRSVLRHVTEDQPDVDQAWNEVRSAFGTHGRSRTPDWSSPMIADTVATLGGWTRLCLSADQTGDRIRFTRAYERMATRTEREALISPAFRALAIEGAPVFHQLGDTLDGEIGP